MTRRGFWIRQYIYHQDGGNRELALRLYYFGTRNDAHAGERARSEMMARLGY